MAQNLQQQFALQGLHDAASLLSVLNLGEKGADTVIIHMGSHSIKIGLASQSQPFIIPTVIAYPRKDGKILFELEKQKEIEQQRQQLFDMQMERILPEIEHQLRKKRFLLIDSKSAKNIRNKQVSFKIFDETNCVNEYQEQGEDSFHMTETSFLQNDLSYGLEKFSFINLPETQARDTSQRPYFVGREALALHRKEQYLLKYPIRYGDLNVNEHDSIHNCVEDLQRILDYALAKYMRLPIKNVEQFNCILVIPDIFVKHHLRYVVHMLLAKMKFKSLFMHTESVMATFAMAMSTACVVDIGSSKISVCCIDEGLLVPKSIQRKHYGGDELNEMLYRLFNRSRGLHYFPKDVLYPDYHYHRMLLECVKEQLTLTEMDLGETVKTCTLKIKEKINERHRKCSQVTFNCSDSLLLAPQSLFYSQMIGILQKVREETMDPSEIPRGDPLQVCESFQDPEDLMQDVIHGMNQQTTGQANILKNVQSFVNKQEETPGNTPSASIAQDLQSEMGDGDATELNGEKIISQYQKMQEPMDLDEMICRSICSIENGDTRKRLAGSIILIGGVTKTRKFTDSLEEALMDRFSKGFDDQIERVNVELYNVQQHQQFQQQQLFLQSTGQPVAEGMPDHLKIDPRFTSWMGASIVPKLESSKDMFIQRDRFIVDFKPYREHFMEYRQQDVQKAIDQVRSEQEEKKLTEDTSAIGFNFDNNLGKQEDKAAGAGQPSNPEDLLSTGQIDNIEKEVVKRLKKDRVFEAGIKQIREKAPFHL